jgi:hypothetical protein
MGSKLFQLVLTTTSVICHTGPFLLMFLGKFHSQFKIEEEKFFKIVASQLMQHMYDCQQASAEGNLQVRKNLHILLMALGYELMIFSFNYHIIYITLTYLLSQIVLPSAHFKIL